ncbi:hypothetical protein [Burkholderia sp. BCC1047]|uniref:hypothetical protein n=1 Tax=Burkholderia sp. BCC1047 TaxID=2676299 RepID=UPI00158A3B07|nr:hypothetical protein [Burkholderia sp. BCC1047]
MDGRAALRCLHNGTDEPMSRDFLSARNFYKDKDSGSADRTKRRRTSEMPIESQKGRPDNPAGLSHIAGRRARIGRSNGFHETYASQSGISV